MQRKYEKHPEKSEIYMLTVSNSEHEYPKQRRELPSTSITLLIACTWRRPNNPRGLLLSAYTWYYLGTYYNINIYYATTIHTSNSAYGSALAKCRYLPWKTGKPKAMPNFYPKPGQPPNWPNFLSNFLGVAFRLKKSQFLYKFRLGGGEIFSILSGVLDSQIASIPISRRTRLNL